MRLKKKGKKEEEGVFLFDYEVVANRNRIISLSFYVVVAMGRGYFYIIMRRSAMAAWFSLH